MKCNAHNLVDCPVCNCPVCKEKKPEGIKYDEGKLEWTLLPWDALACIVRVLMFGRDKYTRDNWREVDPPERYIDACFRHLTRWCDGEKLDGETGFSHLWHAGCCIVFMIWFEREGRL